MGQKNLDLYNGDPSPPCSVLGGGEALLNILYGPTLMRTVNEQKIIEEDSTLAENN